MPRYKRDVSPVRPQQAKPRSRATKKAAPAIVEEVQIGVELSGAKRRARKNADIGSSDNNEVVVMVISAIIAAISDTPNSGNEPQAKQQQ